MAAEGLGEGGKELVLINQLYPHTSKITGLRLAGARGSTKEIGVLLSDQGEDCQLENTKSVESGATGGFKPGKEQGLMFVL